MIEEEIYFNPFPGLRAFEEDEEYLFFGREKQIDDLLDKLEQPHFLAVIGTSGSGKSSLVKSGLLPSLHSGFIRGVGKGWRIGVFRPGDNPIGNLAACLCSDEFITDEAEDDGFNLQPMIESVLRRSDDGIANVVDQFLNKLPENILLVADQFEELFRFSKYEKTSHKGTRDSVLFINLLLAAIKDRKRRIYIVFTMRSDFLGNCTEFRGFPEAINIGQYLIPRMTREEIKLAITGPVAVSGSEISSQLVTMFLNEVGDNPDQLPILQHALMRTCDYWSENTDHEIPIGIADYEAVGRMELALSNHADEAYNELDEDQKIICATLFKTLTESGTTSGGVRRPTKLSELCKILELEKQVLIPVIDVFRERGRSFLMPPLEIELTADSVIDISHESLMRVWLRLVKWFKEETDSSEIYLGICNAAALNEVGKAGLYHDPELQIALKWKEVYSPSELWANRYNSSYHQAMTFLAESKHQFELEIKQKELAEQKKKRRARLFTLFLSLAFLLSVFFAWEAIQEKKSAVKSQGIALIATEAAKKSAENAKKSEHHAKLKALEAMKAKKLADKAEKNAKAEAKIANRMTGVARRKELEAIESSKAAKESEENAVKERSKALQSQKNAEDSEKETERLKNLADARYAAILALKKLDNKETDEGVALAISAQENTIKNKGEERVDVIYEALSKSLNESGKAQLTLDNDFGLRKVVSHPNKNTIAHLNENAQITFVELTADNRLKEILAQELKEVTTFCYSTDGQFLVSCYKDNSIALFDLESNGIPLTQLDKVNIPVDIKEIKSLAKNRFMISSASGISFYQIENNALKESAVSPILKTGVKTIASNGNGSLIAYSYSNVLEVNRFSNSTLNALKKIEFKHLITSLELSIYKNMLVVGMSNGTIRLIDFNSSLEITTDITLSNHSSKITGLKLVQNLKETLLLSSSLDNTVGIVTIDDVLNKVKDAQKGSKLKGHNLWINDISLSFDKKHFFTVSEDKTIRFWFIDPNDIVNILKENKE